MSGRLQAEVDANFEAFKKLLPGIIENERNRWALMKNKKCIAFYDTARDAQSAGNGQFADGIFSVQEVTDSVIDLGWFSYAMH